MDKAPKVNSTLTSLVVAAVAAVGIAFAVEHWRGGSSAIFGGPQATVAQPANGTTASAASRTSATKSSGWTASASGRVEPRDGEVRIGTQMPGKVAQVLVQMNDQVKAGDLLVRMDDDEVKGKLPGVVAETEARRRERDMEPAVKLAADRRTAEDSLAEAERNAFRARMELDRLQMAAARGQVGNSTVPAAGEIETARAALATARNTLESERVNNRRVQALAGMPLPTRLEAGLAMARSELSAMESAVERTRIRAPADGTVLLVNTRAGETASPSPEDVLVVFGDLTLIRVRAELEERDVGKIRTGQTVVVRSDAYPGQDFNGRIIAMANALGAPRLAPKGMRRPTDQDVLQVLVELEGRPPLIPGLRVDVFFRPDSTVNVQSGGASAKN